MAVLYKSMGCLAIALWLGTPTAWAAESDTPDLSPKIEAPVAEPRPINGGAEETVKESADQGEKIFDWSQHQGETEVEHPFAKKGLIRIDKDGTYFYKVEESAERGAYAINGGAMTLNQLSNPSVPSGQSGASFKDNYKTASPPGILITKEWLVSHGDLGRLNLQTGFGFIVAQGHGHFTGTADANLTPLENFTFIALPLNCGVVYRLQWSKHQLFAPYGLGGGTVIPFGELRDDNKGPKAGGALAAYAGGGVGLNMTYFDYLTRVALDREYGIHAIYFTAEYRQIFGFTRYNFSGDFINGGFLIEY